MARNLRRFVIASLALWPLCMAPGMIHAETVKPSDVATVQFEKKWGLLFALADDLDLEPFNSATLALQRFSSPSRGYRVGATLGIHSMRSTNLGYETKSTGYSMTINVQKHYRLSVTTPIVPYVALGPMGGISDSKQFHESKVGLSASAGFEWHPSNAIGIVGEYGSSLQYSYRNDRVTTYDEFNEHEPPIPPHRTRTFEFVPDAVRLGISFYW